MEIAVCQITSTDSFENNINQIATLVNQIKSENNNVRICFFPENSLYFRIREGDKVRFIDLDNLLSSQSNNSFIQTNNGSTETHATKSDSVELLNKIDSQKIVDELKKIAIENGVYLHLTSPFKINNSFYNASVLITSAGELVPLYKKIHLFDIKLAGQKPIKESDIFTAGSEISVFEIDGVTFGSSICYDIRFSELYKKLNEKNVDVILIPAAFLVKTGQAHWEVLLRARAIESQSYVVAAAQVGEHISSYDNNSKRLTFGHTAVVNPWGEIKILNENKTGYIIETLSREKIDIVRTQIPQVNHRRVGIDKLVETKIKL